MDNDKSK